MKNLFLILTLFILSFGSLGAVTCIETFNASWTNADIEFEENLEACSHPLDQGACYFMASGIRKKAQDAAVAVYDCCEFNIGCDD